jgi:hypothetical protein
MDMAAPPLAAAPAVRAGSAARAGGWLVLLGTAISTIGLSWDIEWHVDVGPDTFFTLPHLFLYSGSAISGIASLAMVLLATSARRAGRPWPRSAGGTGVRVFGGAFHAPLGYLISGVGAASFLLYGLMDLWWHSIYGFDAVLNTPSHVALFLSITLTMVGAVAVFAAAGDQRWARIGLLGAVPILIIFAPMPFNGLDQLPLPVDATILGVMLCAPTLLLVGALLLGRGGAVWTALSLGAIQALLWWFSPWAAHAYAAAVGLPLREGLLPRPPQLPVSVPVLLIVAALVVEAARWLHRRRGVAAKPLLLAAGAVGGVVVGVSLPLQLGLASAQHQVPVLAVAELAVFGLPLGLLAGYLGPRFAAMLAPSEEDR